ncbi:MAG: PARP-type zinc finger-containing protein [Methanophagales archaeon]|nr:PARP-type zinc finger-containing protein [Methanophagales archaeon]
MREVYEDSEKTVFKEKAKSGRSICRSCGKKIEKGAVRYRIVIKKSSAFIPPVKLLCERCGLKYEHARDVSPCIGEVIVIITSYAEPYCSSDVFKYTFEISEERKRRLIDTISSFEGITE